MALDDEETRGAIRRLHARGYLADPHSALAWSALERSLEPEENGIFLCTAHPAKFLEVIEDTLEIDMPLPVELAEVKDKAVLSTVLNGDFQSFKNYLLDL